MDKVDSAGSRPTRRQGLPSPHRAGVPNSWLTKIPASIAARPQPSGNPSIRWSMRWRPHAPPFPPPLKPTAFPDWTTRASVHQISSERGRSHAMPCHAGNAIVSGTARYSTVLGRTGREHFQKCLMLQQQPAKETADIRRCWASTSTYCSMFSNRSGERESLFKSSRLFLRLCVRHTEHGSVRTASYKLPLPDSSTRVAAWRCSHLEVRERR